MDYSSLLLDSGKRLENAIKVSNFLKVNVLLSIYYQPGSELKIGVFLKAYFCVFQFSGS